MEQATYAIRADAGDERVVECRDLDGFFIGDRSTYDSYERPDERAYYPLSVQMKGIGVTDASLRYLDEESGIYVLEDGWVEVLDRDGAGMGRYGVWAVTLSLAPSSSSLEQEGILSARVSSLPHRAAEGVWKSWRQSYPRVRGGWATIPAGQREGWVEAAQLRQVQRNATVYSHIVKDDEISLDGKDIVDLASFFCAVGEAFGGPGGYFGSSLMGFNDCLQDTVRGRARRLRLRWTDLEVAQRGLSRIVETSDGPASYFDIILGLLAENSVDVIPSRS